MLWLGGIVLLVGYRMAGSLQLRTIRKQSREVSTDRLLALTRPIARANEINAELRESDTIGVPMTWGVWRAIILLPSRAVEWSDDDLVAVLQHEFGHIRRRDSLTRLLAQIACALCWMNPLVWLAARRLRLAQEIACDDIVLSSGMGATEYANQLVEVVRTIHSATLPVPQALAMAHPSTLEIRIRSIVEPQVSRRPVTPASIAVSAITATVMLFLLTVAQIRAADGPSAGGEMPDAKPTIQPGNAKTVPTSMEGPIELKGDVTNYEKDTAWAKGNAVLNWNNVTIKADVISYHPNARSVGATGHVQLVRHDEQSDTTAHGDSLSYNLETHQLTCDGKVENTPK